MKRLDIGDVVSFELGGYERFGKVCAILIRIKDINGNKTENISYELSTGDTISEDQVLNKYILVCEKKEEELAEHPYDEKLSKDKEESSEDSDYKKSFFDKVKGKKD